MAALLQTKESHGPELPESFTVSRRGVKASRQILRPKSNAWPEPLKSAGGSTGPSLGRDVSGYQRVEGQIHPGGLKVSRSPDEGTEAQS